jgi:hypothetical protein
MSASNPSPAPANPAPRVPTCGGCFKPVDPETSVKRPVYVAQHRRSRYTRALPEPVILHFCNIECRQRADTAADSGGGYF